MKLNEPVMVDENDENRCRRVSIINPIHASVSSIGRHPLRMCQSMHGREKLSCM